MKLFRRITNHFSKRRKALWLYRRGMASAKSGDQQCAIDDYTKTIDSLGVPPDVRAMVLYNRALVLLARGDEKKGLDDLAEILSTDNAPTRVKSMARQKLFRFRNRSHKKSDSNGGP